MYYSGYFDTDSLAEAFPIILGIILGIGILAWIFIYFVKKSDSKKKLETKRVRILEKPVKQGSIEWYVVQADSGERFKLRSFDADKIIITVGDVGIVKYRGSTIVSFTRI